MFEENVDVLSFRTSIRACSIRAAGKFHSFSFRQLYVAKKKVWSFLRWRVRQLAGGSDDQQDVVVSNVNLKEDKRSFGIWNISIISMTKYPMRYPTRCSRSRKLNSPGARSFWWSRHTTLPICSWCWIIFGIFWRLQSEHASKKWVASPPLKRHASNSNAVFLNVALVGGLTTRRPEQKCTDRKKAVFFSNFLGPWASSRLQFTSCYVLEHWWLIFHKVSSKELCYDA